MSLSIHLIFQNFSPLNTFFHFIFVLLLSSKFNFLMQLFFLFFLPSKLSILFHLICLFFLRIFFSFVQDSDYSIQFVFLSPFHLYFICFSFDSYIFIHSFNQEVSFLFHISPSFLLFFHSFTLTSY